MARVSLALGVALAMAGCSSVASHIGEQPSGEFQQVVALDEALFSPDVATVGSRDLPRLLPPKAFGLGYFWIGYAALDVGTRELSNIGAGDGFSIGAGFKVHDTSRSFVEIVTEKTLKHDVPLSVYTALSGAAPTLEGFEPTGYNERLMFGGRTSASPKARLERQPRAYTSYGIEYNVFKARAEAGGGSVLEYVVNGTGIYLGFGVEFPFAERTSLSFDLKYHAFQATDVIDNEGTFGSIAYALLWLSRF